MCIETRARTRGEAKRSRHFGNFAIASLSSWIS
ncbi:hypothetical protein ABH999_006870 [Bradyrhizobium yuanmingense]